MDVLLINILISIPVFIGLWLLLKKKHHRLSLTFTGTLVITPIVYVLIISAWVFFDSYYPTKSFNQISWKSDPMTRYEMTQDLIQSELLIGKSKTEIESILGEQSSNFEKDHWRYEIGYVPSLLNIDPSMLDIYFVDDIVVKVDERKS